MTECGTVAGARWHKRHGVPTCDACRAAHTAYVREWRRARRGDRVVMVPAIGVTRRLRALACDGCTSQQIAAVTYLPATYVVHLWAGKKERVYLSTYFAVKRAYDDQSWRGKASPITARRATDAGWHSSIAWSDETIDDPEARPNYTGYDETVVRAVLRREPTAARVVDKVEAVERLREAGLSNAEILRYPGMHKQLVYRTRQGQGVA